jgi:hypothetical protein
VVTEARFALGSRKGPRSTIWKAWVHGDDAYIASRMFGSDMKVSLHASGDCQWSATDTWVRRQPNVRNAERHVTRWHISHPANDEALLAFKVEIPTSELRVLPEPRDKKKVWWVGNTSPESTARFLFYLTRTNDVDPAPDSSPLQKHLFSLRFRDSRWLVVLVDFISRSEADLSALREAVIRQAKSWGLSAPEPDHRACLFSQPPPEGGAHGLLELCLTEESGNDGR